MKEEIVGRDYAAWIMDWTILGLDYLVELIYVELSATHCELCGFDLKKVWVALGLGPGNNPHGINISKEVLSNNSTIQGSEQKQIENLRVSCEI